MTKKTILIVEDEKTISFNLNIYCTVAAKELKKELIEINYDLVSINETEKRLWAELACDVDVLVVENIEDAWKEIESNNIIFVSLDLNLNDNKKGKEASGMAFLRNLREKQLQTMVLIASSENEISNSTEALQRLKAIGYYIKSELNKDSYIKAVKSVLLYQTALDMISANYEDYDVACIELADHYEKMARQRAENANINYGNFPADLAGKIVYANSKLDKITKLPEKEWVDKVFRKYIVSKTDWSIIKVEVSNLNDILASQIDILQYYIAGKLKEIASIFNYKDVFIGKYQFGSHPVFIVVVKHNIIGDYAKISGWLSEEFNKDKFKFTENYVLLEIKKEQPSEKSIPQLEMNAWHSNTNIFFDLHDIINTLGRAIS